jgi:hypothetical protein
MDPSLAIILVGVGIAVGLAIYFIISIDRLRRKNQKDRLRLGDDRC